jgi:hypothetical protein
MLMVPVCPESGFLDVLSGRRPLTTALRLTNGIALELSERGIPVA